MIPHTDMSVEVKKKKKERSFFSFLYVTLFDELLWFVTILLSSL